MATPRPSDDWPLNSSHHKIDHGAAQALIKAYGTDMAGAYFTAQTIRGMMTTNCAGIRYYFTLHNKNLTVMITAVRKVAAGVYDDIIDQPQFAVSNSLNVVAADSGQSISPDNASAGNLSYRKSHYYADLCKGGMFGIEAFRDILAQNDCHGIRFYFGKDATNKKTIVLYGVNSSGENLLTYIGDQNCPCPNFCSNNNALNT